MFDIQKFSLLLFMSLYYSSVGAVTRSTQVDIMIRGLEEQAWLEAEEPCLKDLSFLLNGVKNHTLWAVYIWNANQFPVGTFFGNKYSLGNYDQCLKASSIVGESVMRTQYCLADVKLTDGEAVVGSGKPNVFGVTDDFLETKLEFGLILNSMTWGVCLPATCDPITVSKILKVFYSLNPITRDEPEITVDSCELEGEEKVYSTAFYAFLASMSSLMVAAILSTCFFQYIERETRASKMAYSFSLKRNWSTFCRASDSEIPVLNFIKTIQVMFVTSTHSVVYTVVGSVSNYAYIDQLYAANDNVLSKTFHHFDLPALENFFVMSGFLFMTSLLKKKKKPIIILIQRYIRLIGSFAFIVLFSISVMKYTGDGPLWNKLSSEEEKICQENWFWSLLMLNNYVNSDNICQIVTWYIPCDFQLAIMAVVLYIIWQWNKRVGKLMFVILVALGFLIPGAVTYWKQIRGILLYDMEKIRGIRSNLVFLNIYIKAHNRFGPYLFGMATGYILIHYHPAKYRGVISKKLAYIGYAIACIVNVNVLLSAGSWCLGEYNAWNSAIYAAFNRNIWALMTCLIIVITEYGDISKLRDIMAWRGFVITSRLAYGVYVIHSLIIARNISLQRNPVHYDIFTEITNSVGVMGLSMLASIWLWLFIEAPLINLTNLVLDPITQKMDKGIKRK